MVSTIAETKDWLGKAAKDVANLKLFAKAKESDGKFYLFPVYYPKPETSIEDYLATLEKLGLIDNRVSFLNKGIDLYFRSRGKTGLKAGTRKTLGAEELAVISRHAASSSEAAAQVAKALGENNLIGLFNSIAPKYQAIGGTQCSKEIAAELKSDVRIWLSEQGVEE